MKVPMKSIAAKSIAPRFCAVTTELVRTALSLACSRRIASVGLLAGLLALLTATVATFAGPTERVSVASDGTQANFRSGTCDFCPTSAPAISADGRFFVFFSLASNLAPRGEGTLGWPHVFVRDRQSGTTERVSVDSAGNPGNGYNLRPTISADGRFVAFDSDVTTLVPEDTNGSTDVF